MPSCTIETITTGYRTVAGTDWPITASVIRQPKRRGASGRMTYRWLLTYGVCNGVAAGADVFRTRRAALAALHDVN